MHIFINAVKRAEEKAREYECIGLQVDFVYWQQELPQPLMSALIRDQLREELRADCFNMSPALFRDCTRYVS